MVDQAASLTPEKIMDQVSFTKFTIIFYQNHLMEETVEMAETSTSDLQVVYLAFTTSEEPIFSEIMENTVW